MRDSQSVGTSTFALSFCVRGARLSPVAFTSLPPRGPGPASRSYESAPASRPASRSRKPVLRVGPTADPQRNARRPGAPAADPARTATVDACREPAPHYRCDCPRWTLTIATVTTGTLTHRHIDAIRH